MWSFSCEAEIAMIAKKVFIIILKKIGLLKQRKGDLL